MTSILAQCAVVQIAAALGPLRQFVVPWPASWPTAVPAGLVGLAMLARHRGRLRPLLGLVSVVGLLALTVASSFVLVPGRTNS